MARRPPRVEALLGPRPRLTLVVDDMFVREIWVDGRAPIVTIHDYDWGATDPDPAFDAEGFAFSPINWRGPAWTLGLSLHPPIKETYTMANQILKTIPLTDLKVSKLNMRHARKKPDIFDLLPSIRAHGLRQTLLVRKEGDKFGVVAGRRRLFALKQIAKEEGVAMKVPCIVMTADDDAAAIEASILENAARLPATEMQQYEAFGRLAAEGRAPAEIAEYIGITELAVRRVLALANLLGPIRTLFGNEKVDRQTVYALTLATEDQQTEWLRLYNSDDEREPRGRNCKAWVTGGATITTDKALFDLDTFDGTVVADLFGEQGVFADAGAFWSAQSAAIAELVETFTQAGWSDVQVMDRGDFFQSWDYQKRARTKGGKVYVEVRHDGTVTVYEGYISAAEARRIERAAAGEDNTDRSTRPEMTKSMADYLGQHRRLGASAVLISQPAIALRLMVAHALVGSSLWTVRSHGFSPKNDAVAESLEASPAASEIEAATTKTAEMFKAHGLGTVHHNGDDYHLCEVFVALLGMDDSEVLHILTTAMIGSLEAGGAIVEALAAATETDMSLHWKPDAAFFDLLRDKRAINAMIAEIASPGTSKECLTDTAKAQKELLANRINGEGCSPNPEWRPGWMHVPATFYVEGAASRPADQWSRIASLFTAEAETEESEADALAA